MPNRPRYEMAKSVNMARILNDRVRRLPISRLLENRFSVLDSVLAAGKTSQSQALRYISRWGGCAGQREI